MTEVSSFKFQVPSAKSAAGSAGDRSGLVEDIQGRMKDMRALWARNFCAQPMQREVSLPQLHVLLSLTDQGPMTVSRLAQVFGLSLPSASSILDRMEERDLVARTRQDADRRVVTVDLTQKGRDAASEFMGIKREQTQRILDAMTEEELASVAKGLEALHAALARAGEVSGQTEAAN